MFTLGLLIRVAIFVTINYYTSTLWLYNKHPKVNVLLWVVVLLISAVFISFTFTKKRK